MKKMFLCSSFKDVAELFKGFANEDLQEKTVTFIPTASIPEKMKFFVAAGRKALEKIGLTIDELEITQATREDISKKLNKNDYIYVTGGNTFYLLQELKKSGAGELIREYVDRGKLYIGESAGSIIMAPNIEYVKDMDDCKKAPDLRTYAGLNGVDFFPLPHHTNFPFKKAVEKIIQTFQPQIRLCPISNSQVILVSGNEVRIEGM